MKNIFYPTKYIIEVKLIPAINAEAGSVIIHERTICLRRDLSI